MIRRQPHGVVRDGGFGRPDPARPAAEAAGMRLDAEAQLFGGVVEMLERPARHRQVGSCDARDSQVGDQRQDGMVVGAGDQLRLPAFLQLAIFGQHLAQQFELDPQHGLYVGVGKEALLAHQFGNLRVTLDHLGADP